MNRSFRALLALCLAFVFLFSGCEAKPEETEAPTEEMFHYEDLDFSQIADAIYKRIDLSNLTRQSVSRITDETTLAEQFYLDFDKVIAWEVRSAEGNFGVADLMLLRVKEDCAADVLSAIENRKDDRINEFSHYDVYDSYQIALNAEIYQEGELVIMLMFSDEGKTEAKAVLDTYLT